MTEAFDEPGDAERDDDDFSAETAEGVDPAELDLDDLEDDDGVPAEEDEDDL